MMMVIIIIIMFMMSRIALIDQRNDIELLMI